MRDLPSGTVTFLFTDIEGSTRLMERLGEADYVEALAEHRTRLRSAFAAHAGVEVDTQGDAFLYAFAEAEEAVQAAQAGQEALANGPVKVRMGLHTGQARLTGEGYAGRELHRAARIAASGHGGQVVLSAATRALVGVEVSELGEHRLKDFPQPIALFQLGTTRFPPLKTLSNTNLPRPASSFVGRERETQEVIALIESGARLVTLSGPGGSGKTRLAIEAALELVPGFKAGVFWVPLAPLRDPGLVIDTIARTLGAQDGLAEHIDGRELLLVLDNLEQVIEAAPQLGELLEACGNLKLLVTSRELLRIRGEIEYPVAPLTDQTAVELFCERSRLDPDETIGELCRCLDNLPLAIELAAARTRLLSPPQILERLAQRLDLLKGGPDVEARQQTLRATIEWSYDLLEDDEKQLLTRLAVFRGGCTLEAAEAVADADLDVLQSLVDKSLVRRTGDRFWMLETIREYAGELLGTEAGIQRRHAEWYLALAEEVEPELDASSRAPLDMLEREHDNFRAAFDVLEPEEAFRLGGALGRFWAMRGHIPEGLERLTRALAADGRPTLSRAKALRVTAALSTESSEHLPLAVARAGEACAIYESLGDAEGRVWATLALAGAHAAQEQWETARSLFVESIALGEQLGDDGMPIVLLGTRMFAWMHFESGDLEAARRLHEENLERARAHGDSRIVSSTLGALAEYAIRDRDLARALPLLDEAIAMHRDLGQRIEIIVDLARLAQAVLVAGSPEVATEILAASEALKTAVGARVGWMDEFNEKTLAQIRQQLDGAAFDAAWQRGQAVSPDEAIARGRHAISGAVQS